MHEALIEAHYARQRYFLEDGQILRNAHDLPDVPTVIVHGRQDLTCTLESSWMLHRAVTHSRLVIVPDTGHLASEPGIIDALVAASDDFCAHYSGAKK